MKKILAIIMSVSMMAAFAGCSNSNPAPADEVTDTSVTTEATTEATTTEATTTEAETTTTTEATTTEAQTEASSDSNALEGTLTGQLMDKLTNWKDGNIIIDVNMEEEGTKVNLYMNTYDNKAVIDMKVEGMFDTKTVFDGEKTYMISDTNKNYCEATQPDTEGQDAINDLLVDNDDAAKLSDTGKETIDGTDYTFEEIESEDGSKIRYYFDDNGDVHYVGAYEDDKFMTASFEVTFLSAPDDTAFTVPEGYEEIDEEAFAMQLIASMFAAMGGGDMGDIDLSGLDFNAE